MYIQRHYEPMPLCGKLVKVKNRNNTHPKFYILGWLCTDTSPVRLGERYDNFPILLTEGEYRALPRLKLHQRIVDLMYMGVLYPPITCEPRSSMLRIEAVDVDGISPEIGVSIAHRVLAKAKARAINNPSLIMQPEDVCDYVEDPA